MIQARSSKKKYCGMIIAVFLLGITVLYLTGCESKEPEVKMSEEEFKKSCSDVSILDLINKEAEYTDKKIHVTSVILQGMYEGDEYTSAGAFSEDCNTILVDIPSGLDPQSNETIEIWGTYKGISSESLGMSSSDSGPWIIAEYIKKQN